MPSITWELDKDDLYVADVRIDEGPTMKRWRPRMRGMPAPILKRTSHIYSSCQGKGGMTGWDRRFIPIV